MANEKWIEHAYPLKQIVVKLQGTRHSDSNAIIEQLEIVLERLRAGDMTGCDNDDDFGYSFYMKEASTEPSFFIEG